MVHVVLRHHIHDAGVFEDINGALDPEVIGFHDIFDARIYQALGRTADTLGIGAAVFYHQLQLVLGAADVKAALLVDVITQRLHLNLVVVVNGSKPAGGVQQRADFQHVITRGRSVLIRCRSSRRISCACRRRIIGGCTAAAAAAGRKTQYHRCRQQQGK